MRRARALVFATTVLALAFALVAVMCACSTTPATTTAPPGAPHALLGAWRGPPVDVTGPDGACPLELELFDDGTAEVNQFDDDSAAESCMFARLPWRTTQDEHGRVLWLADAFACRFAVDGAAGLLRLACEDHGTPPRTLDGALTLVRYAVQERRGIAALAGPVAHGGDVREARRARHRGRRDRALRRRERARRRGGRRQCAHRAWRVGVGVPISRDSVALHARLQRPRCAGAGVGERR